MALDLLAASRMTTSDSSDIGATRASAVFPTVLLGVGLGGFFDGIALHQILQWHHMLSSHTPPDTLAGLELNTLADGLFHASSWVFTTLGVILLWRAIRNEAALGWNRLFGGLLAGWGVFNVLEGLVDHHILGVHHVRAGPDELLWDVAFLIWGALMLGVGTALIRSAREGEPATGR